MNTSGKIESVSEQIRGVSYKPEQVSDVLQNGYIPLLRAGNITENGIDYTDLVYVQEKCVSDIQILKYGDILIAASSGSKSVVGKAAQNINPNFKCTFGAFCKVIRPSKSINPKYLGYYFRSEKYRAIISNLSAGANINNIRNEDLNQLDIHLPPLPIQQQIADTLDKADALRRKDQELLDKYEELAQAVFYEMFGDPVRNEKGWEGQKLKDICTQITDGTHFSPPSVPVGVPYITAKHVKKHGLDFFANPTYIDENNHKEIYKRCRPEKGDVLYIKDGATTGLAAINDYDFEFSMLSSLALIKPNQSVLSSVFLKYWLNNNKVKSKLINEFMAGAAIQRFTLSKINQFQVYLPPLRLQILFGEKIFKLEKLKLLHSKSCTSSKSLFDALISKSFNN